MLPEFRLTPAALFCSLLGMGKLTVQQPQLTLPEMALRYPKTWVSPHPKSFLYSNIKSKNKYLENTQNTQNTKTLTNHSGWKWKGISSPLLGHWGLRSCFKVKCAASLYSSYFPFLFCVPFLPSLLTFIPTVRWLAWVSPKRPASRATWNLWLTMFFKHHAATKAWQDDR